WQATRNITGNRSGGLRSLAFVCQADSVFPFDHTAPRQYLSKKIVKRALHSFADSRIPIVTVRHDIDVNVAVPRMPEAGDRESMLGLQFVGEFDKIYEMTPRHDNVFVQFRQAGCAQRVAELAPQRPE